jgi:hypothetical protein
VEDTSPSANQRYFQLLRRQTPAQKLRTVAGLTAAVRRLALAGIRTRHPELSPDEHERLLATRLYGVHR